MPADPSPPLYVLYGSATGNAEHIAKALAARVPGAVCGALDEFKRRNWLAAWEAPPAPPRRRHAVLVVTSTTGNGDAPENASRFLRLLKRKTTPATTFRHCAFAVLGLGDSNYDKFCQAGKDVDRRLHELGGARCRPLACADEATGLEDVVEPWTQTVLADIFRARDGAVEATEAEPNGNGGAVGGETTEKRDDEQSTAAGTADVEEPPIASASLGVQIVRSLLNVPETETLDPVDVELLPRLTSTLSSCRLVHHDAVGVDEEILLASGRDRSSSLAETMSSASSSTLHYNLLRPFASPMLKARYLTNTPTDAAKQIAALSTADRDAFHEEAARILEQHFPLTANGATAASKRNDKRVIELTLQLPDDYTLEYAPGDSLGLSVENPPAAVAFVLEMLARHHSLTRDQLLSVDGDSPRTIEHIVRSTVDLSSPIKNKRILATLAQYASCTQEALSLQWLASKSPAGQASFDSFIDKQKITFIDLLRLFPSCQTIPIEGLLGMLPGIPPRYYSVSSSPLARRNLSLTIAFSVVDYLTPSLIIDGQEVGRKRVHGVATSFMEMACARLICGQTGTDTDTLPIFPKPTTEFRMPTSLSVPLVLIGPGTGVAPFMGFLEHREALSSQSESTEVAHTVVEGTWRGGIELDENEVPVAQQDASGLNVAVDFRARQTRGSVDLFFGCRHRDHDWLYRDEMLSYKAKKIVSELHTAFSRDGNRQYVQDVMKTESCRKRLSDLILKDRAHVYLCGDGNEMAKDVQAAIIEILAEDIVSGIDGATTYLEVMKREQRFVMDIWS